MMVEMELRLSIGQAGHSKRQAPSHPHLSILLLEGEVEAESLDQRKNRHAQNSVEDSLSVISFGQAESSEYQTPSHSTVHESVVRDSSSHARNLDEDGPNTSTNLIENAANASNTESGN